MLHVGFRAMHESMTSQKIKKLGAGGPSLVGGQNFWWGGHGPPGPPAGYGPGRHLVVMYTHAQKRQI